MEANGHDHPQGLKDQIVCIEKLADKIEIIKCILNS